MLRKKILIIEDEISLLKVLSKKFEEEKFTILKARNGQEGLAMALREHPNLILLDIIMPKMDGYDVLEKLNEDHNKTPVIIILLTNLSDAKKVETARSQGVYDYLVKSDWKLEDVICLAKKRLKK